MDVVGPRVQDLARTEWAAARKRAIASKEPYCAICHKYIDITLPPMTPLSVEVDHIVPRSRGGALYELENLQLTHMKCNRKKGARMAEDYDGVTVDNPFPLSNNW